MFDPKKIFDMLKNAGEMQKNMSEKLKTNKATGEAGAGMVKVVMNGHFEIESIDIDNALMSEDKNFIQDVIKSAINDASTQILAQMTDHLKALTGGLGL
ncbi:MAG: YbaB/EbfC family nucleoid-associated protein [Myxococcales bacterium]|nr:YbaB/EbfC family nucleoid-associated protein [Myxococcales bacterium]